MDIVACRISNLTARLFASPLMVLFLIVASIISGIWAVAAWSGLAGNLFLSVLSLALSSALIFVGVARDETARKRDEAMHLKIDELLRGVPDADSSKAGIEKD